MSKKNKAGSMILGVAFVWFTTHFGGGFASGAQIYSYYVRYGIWSLFLPLFAMAYNGVFFAYCLYFARKHEVYDYRSYNNAFYGRFAPLFPICLSSCTSALCASPRPLPSQPAAQR